MRIGKKLDFVLGYGFQCASEESNRLLSFNFFFKKMTFFTFFKRTLFSFWEMVV